MGSVDKKDAKGAEDSFKQEIHSKVIRAGKRTYFFDVKSTRNDEYYLTITESKRKYVDNGNFQYEKHKIFLYKEDFGKFVDSLEKVIAYIREKQPEQEEAEDTVREEGKVEEEIVILEDHASQSYTNVDFEDI